MLIIFSDSIFPQFDSYLRSLKIDQNNICLVTDGQLPLRQCLHPEAVTKDIHLPAYYWKFSDLKKDYAKTTSQDLLRPSNNTINNNNNNTNNSNNNDVSKLPNLQPASHPAPIALAEMLNGELISGWSSLWHGFFCVVFVFGVVISPMPCLS